MKFLVGVFALFGCAAAVAVAAGGPPDRGGEAPAAHLSRAGSKHARPRITAHPSRVTLATEAVFRFRLRRGRHRFVCRLDKGPARRCRSPFRIRHIDIGSHRFSVRAAGRSGRRGRASRFRWQIVEPTPFEITTRTEGLRNLYPGAPPVELPLRVTNPNPEPIFVVSLNVSVPQSPAGCDAGENLALTPSSASESSPLEVGPGEAVELPGSGISAPAIQLRDLPRSQDACQDARFQLEFTGAAHG
jgi:hypothetical protein